MSSDVATDVDPLRSSVELFQVDGENLTDDDLSALCGGPVPIEGDRPILLSMLKTAKSVIVEREYIDKDYRNVYSMYYSRKFARSSSRTTRLHLFQVSLSHEDLFESVPPTGLFARLKEAAAAAGLEPYHGTTPGYIGFIVIRPTEYSRIGRTLIDPRKVASTPPDPAVCALTRYKGSIVGHQLEVSAFPHQSQDAEVHVCAHTAVWSLFRYLSQKYPIYREHYPHDIALLNTDLGRGRAVPGRGLYMDQVTAMFGRFGVGAELYDLELLLDVFEDFTSKGSAGWATPRMLRSSQKSLRPERWISHNENCSTSCAPTSIAECRL